MITECPIIAAVYLLSVILTVIWCILEHALDAHTPLGIATFFINIGAVTIALINTIVYLFIIGSIWPAVAIILVFGTPLLIYGYKYKKERNHSDEDLKRRVREIKDMKDKE